MGTQVVGLDDHLDGVVYDLPENAYFASPALSSTQVKWLIDCPARYRFNLLNPPPPKDEFNLGSALHTKVLGTGWDVEVLPFDAYTTRAAKQARDEAYASGRVPLLMKQKVMVDAMAESILADADARDHLEHGKPEVSVFATDPDTRIDMRCRFDWLDEDENVAVDLKTTAGMCTIEGFSDAVARWGYDVSQGHYLDTMELATGDRPRMRYIVVEKTAPYFTAVLKLSSDEMKMGVIEARSARARLRACLNADIWPDRPTGIQTTRAPMWRIYQYQDRYGEIND